MDSAMSDMPNVPNMPSSTRKAYMFLLFVAFVAVTFTAIYRGVHYHYDHSHTWASAIHAKVGDTSVPSAFPITFTMRCPSQPAIVQIADKDGKPSASSVSVLMPGAVYSSYTVDIDIRSGELRTYDVKLPDSGFSCVAASVGK